MEGTQFDFSYAPGVTEEQILGFEMAGQIWSQRLTDDVTVNIYVEMTNQLPENVIGGALPGMKKDVEYKKVWEKMQDDITTQNDLTAFYHSYGDKEFGALMNGQELEKVKKLKLTNANSKALDILDGDRDKLDGYILMNDLTGQSNAQWDYDPLRSGNIASNSLDFVSVAMHEIGHVMGFVRGMADGDWLNVVTESYQKGENIKGDKVKFATPLDLFRYSNASAALGQVDLSVGGDAFFSIDGGQTNLGNFSTGEYTNIGGDGYQASHWKQSGNNPLGIMDPALKMGQERNISGLDTTAMDVMGWDVVDPGQINWQQLYDNALDDADDASIEDREKDVEKMVKESQTYHGRRSRSSGSWLIGLWQHIKFQTLDVDIDIDNNTLGSEFKVAEILVDNYLSGFEGNFTVNNNSNEAALADIDTIDTMVEVTEVVAQLIEDGEAILAEYATLDLEKLGSVLSEQLSDIVEADEASLVMSIA